MKTLSMAVLAFMFVAFFSIANAEDVKAQDKDHYPIGQLVALEGKAFYSKDENHTEMKLNDPVFLNTVVETGPASRALILFVDNTQITLGENSEVVIDEFVFDPYDPAENKGAFEMTKGPFLWVSGLISKRKDPQVDIKTKMGSIGIRGTKFWGGGVGDDRYGVYTFEGLVNFKTANGNIDIPKSSGVIIGTPKDDLGTQGWKEQTLNDAVETVTFHNQAAVDKDVAGRMAANTANQHDYRGRMFPYKENPMEPRIKSKDDEFFTDEFEQQMDKQ